MENKENKQPVNKKILIGVIALAAMAAIMAGIFFICRPKPVTGSKQITIAVTNKAEETKTYELRTDAEYLKQAMEEAEGLTFSGTESEYGMMIDTINGERADYNTDGAYWAFYVNDDYCNYGIDSQPVMDGDRFGIVYTGSGME